jgi:hypothetical protein
MEESDTYLMIFEQGQQIQGRMNILIVGEERLGPCDEAVRSQLANITDLDRLKRMLRCAVEAASWQEIIETP